jgi:CubicO group peptidase (beta-lactamase class C family)
MATASPAIEARASELFAQVQAAKLDRSQLSEAASAELTPDVERQAATALRRLGKPIAFTFVGSQFYPKSRDEGYSFRVDFRKKPPRVWFFAVDPHGKIDNLLFYPYVAPAAHLTEAQLLSALRRKLNRDAGAGRFSGDVLVAKDGKPIFARAYGLADRERKIPNALETKFRVGSMDKMFTAVAILQLVQSGKVDLNARLIHYLPDYPNKTLASKVTIDDLLTHTGGTGDIFGPAFDAHRLQLRTLDDYVGLYGKRPLEFEPGSRFDYSNYGFILLGVVIQKVSGESYYDYVHSHIFDPAGMTATGFAPEYQTVARRSVGYTRMNGPLQPNTDTLPYRGTSAGGGYSTVADLLRFANALDAGKLLDANHTKLLTTGKVVMPESIPPDLSLYAYGFGDQTMNGTRCFGHSGGAPGMSGDLEICPVPNYVTAVLANVDPPAADDISGYVVSRLPLH